MRRLNAQEIARYDLVPPEISRRARVQKVPFLAPGSHGMTVGRLILLLRDDDRSGRRTLLAHELVHVEQYAELGSVRFLQRYFGEYFANLWRLRNHRQAYLAISLEAEARAASERWRRDLAQYS
ncbi:MAG: DUF4157 domain-containing protein [Acidimicrobiaceae bacterium]|nr:DUF4157 domain-containing protein [Acidimicrobiaceae bacterium]MYF44103.1 DUF4157 domain-containing protein [Acidimicrobiaceae bacterium]MYJ35134.1 DUF4157 domain-containing protein [Acidimicrobiaceae bacterium]